VLVTGGWSGDLSVRSPLVADGLPRYITEKGMQMARVSETTGRCEPNQDGTGDQDRWTAPRGISGFSIETRGEDSDPFLCSVDTRGVGYL
jgi:hypothetical protein